MNNENELLVQKYKQNGGTDLILRNKIIESYAPLVKIIAGKLNLSLGTILDYDDLVSYGVIGLMKALNSFNLNANVQFSTYATFRIRGEILDEIRRLDSLSRTIRNKQKLINQAKTTLLSKGNSNPTIEQIAQEANITLDQYYEIESILDLNNTSSLDTSIDTDDGVMMVLDIAQNTFITPEENIDKIVTKKLIAEALDQLTDREREVIILAYYEEMTLSEIASVLDISESRVSQLHKKALLKLKNNLGHEFGYFTL